APAAGSRSSLPRRWQAAGIQDRVASGLSRCECIHPCIQALDRKDAEPNASGPRLICRVGKRDEGEAERVGLSNSQRASHASPTRDRTRAYCAIPVPYSAAAGGCFASTRVVLFA